jgi:hypothetical protein
MTTQNVTMRQQVKYHNIPNLHVLRMILMGILLGKGGIVPSVLQIVLDE